MPYACRTCTATYRQQCYCDRRVLSSREDTSENKQSEPPHNGVPKEQGEMAKLLVDLPVRSRGISRTPDGQRVCPTLSAHGGALGLLLNQPTAATLSRLARPAVALTEKKLHVLHRHLRRLFVRCQVIRRLLVPRAALFFSFFFSFLHLDVSTLCVALCLLFFSLESEC